MSSIALRLEAADREPFWLNGDPAKDPRKFSGVLNPTWNLGRGQQGQSGTEWETMQFKDRKNQQVSVTGGAYYTFESYIEKMDYVARLMHVDPAQQLHRWEGDVWVRVYEVDGGAFTEYCMPRAVISLAGVDVGTETKMTLTYRVQAGGISATGGGAFRLASFFAYTEYAPARLTPTGDQMDAQITSLGIAYGTGAIEIQRTDASGILQVMSWPLAGYASSGLGWPIGSAFATMAAQWATEFGSGLTALTDPWRLDIQSGNTGAEAYVAINFFVNGGLYPWAENEGGFGGLIKPLRGEGGVVLVGDIGG